MQWCLEPARTHQSPQIATCNYLQTHDKYQMCVHCVCTDIAPIQEPNLKKNDATRRTLSEHHRYRILQILAECLQPSRTDDAVHHSVVAAECHHHRVCRPESEQANNAHKHVRFGCEI